MYQGEFTRYVFGKIFPTKASFQRDLRVTQSALIAIFKRNSPVIINTYGKINWCKDWLWKHYIIFIALRKCHVHKNRSLLLPSKRGTKMKQTGLNTLRLMLMQKTCLLNTVKIVATVLTTNPRRSAVDREDESNWNQKENITSNAD